MKNVLITGASGNLGQAVVHKMLVDGFHVVGTIIPNDPAGIEINGQHFETAIVDLLDEKAATHFVESVTVKLKTIDAAILTVGGFAMGKISETSTTDINKQIKLNFETAYNVARPVFKQMLQQGSGRIFLIGSKPGLSAANSTGMVAYGLAKSLIFRLAELMNDEAKGTNVVTSVIIPSTIDTPQNRESMPAADFTKWVKPEAIADIISFHCSPAASSLREPVIKIYGNA